MPRRVRQRLLSDAIEGDLDRARQPPPAEPGGVERNLEPDQPRLLGGVALQGGPQAEIVEDRRSQSPRQPSQLIEGLRHQLALPGDGEPDLLQRARVLGAAQPHEEGGGRAAPVRPACDR